MANSCVRGKAASAADTPRSKSCLCLAFEMKFSKALSTPLSPTCIAAVTGWAGCETPEFVYGRWLNHLDPSVNHGKWTQKENIILMQKQAELGNHWSKIRQFLPGRADNSIKNQWHWVLKRRVESAKAAGTMPNLLYVPPESQAADYHIPSSSAPGLDWLQQPPHRLPPPPVFQAGPAHASAPFSVQPTPSQVPPTPPSPNTFCIIRAMLTTVSVQ